MVDPDSPPAGQAVGEGGAPDLRRPSKRRKAPPPGTPFRHPHSAQRQPARAHAVGLVLGPHARTNRTPEQTGRGTPAARPRGQAAGEGQHLTPDAPHSSGGPPPRERPPTTPAARSPHSACKTRGQCWAPTAQTRAHSTWRADPDCPPRGRAVGGGGAPDLRRPSRRRKAPPPGTPFRHPHSAQRQPARAHGPGPVLGPHARTNRTPGHTGHGTSAARPRGQAAGGGTAPDNRHPSQRWRPPPLGTAPHQPRGTQPQQGVQAKETVLGPHTRTPRPTARG